MGGIVLDYGLIDQIAYGYPVYLAHVGWSRKLLRLYEAAGHPDIS